MGASLSYKAMSRVNNQLRGGSTGTIHYRHQLFDAPNVVGDTSFHGGCDTECLVDSTEIVVHEVERHGPTVVLDLLREGVC